MPNLNFYDRDGTLRSLPLTAIETTAYADFHKRSETTYPDLSITAYDLPIATLTKRDTTVVYCHSSDNPILFYQLLPYIL